MLLTKQKKAQVAKGNRVLITINVLGSAGPLRFVVYEDQLVAGVIDMALKSYAREGRRPILGSDLSEFFLYCPAAGSDALCPWETIGAHGGRNFMLCKKPIPDKGGEALSPTVVTDKKESRSLKSGEALSPTVVTDKKESRNLKGGDGETASPTPVPNKKGSGSWKAWFNKSLSFKIASH